MTCSVVAAWARPKAWPNSWRATEPQVPPAPLVGAARERSSRSNTTSAWEIQAFGLPQDQRLLTCARPTTDPATRESLAGTNDTVTKSEEHTSELQSLMRISYAVFCLQKKKQQPQLIITSHKLK